MCSVVGFLSDVCTGLFAAPSLSQSLSSTMAHARYTSPHTDTPYPYHPKRSPAPLMAGWSANEDPLYVHPDRLDGYMCYAGAVVSDTFSNGVAPKAGYGPRTTGVLMDNAQVQTVAGVKRRWREAPYEESLSPLYEEQTENAKVSVLACKTCKHFSRHLHQHCQWTCTRSHSLACQKPFPLLYKNTLL